MNGCGRVTHVAVSSEGVEHKLEQVEGIEAHQQHTAFAQGDGIAGINVQYLRKKFACNPMEVYQCSK